jgi:hypothetical protein
MESVRAETAHIAGLPADVDNKSSLLSRNIVLPSISGISVPEFQLWIVANEFACRINVSANRFTSSNRGLHWKQLIDARVFKLGDTLGHPSRIVAAPPRVNLHEGMASRSNSAKSKRNQSGCS